MVRSVTTVTALRARLHPAGLAASAAHELVAGVVLQAARPRAAVLACVTNMAAWLEASVPDHRVAVREAMVLSEVDLLRPEVALCRPLLRAEAAAGLALAVFIGEREGPLRWRAQRCGRAGVVESWTLAVGEGRASRWREPGPHGYGRRDPLEPGARLALDAAPERWLEVRW